MLNVYAGVFDRLSGMVETSLTRVEQSIANIFKTLGFAAFGLIVGWLCHAVVMNTPVLNVKWFSSIVAVIGGGTLSAIFGSDYLFGGYAIGLVLGFFGHAIWSALVWAFGPHLSAFRAAMEHHASIVKRELIAEIDSPSPVYTGERDSRRRPRAVIASALIGSCFLLIGAVACAVA
jgi:hypothetical protein